MVEPKELSGTYLEPGLEIRTKTSILKCFISLMYEGFGVSTQFLQCTFTFLDSFFELGLGDLKTTVLVLVLNVESIDKPLRLFCRKLCCVNKLQI